MAAPAYVAASTGTTDAGGAWTHTTNAPGASGRLIICHVFQDGTSANNAITITSATNCTNLAGTSGQFTALASTGYPLGDVSTPTGYHYIFFARSSSTSAVVITGGNSGTNDIYVRCYEFSGVATGTTVASIIENTTEGGVTSTAGTSASVTMTDVVTRARDRLPLGFIAVADEIQAAELTAMTGETGGDWTYPVAAFGTATGTDGSLALVSSSMAAAGTITGGSDAITSDEWGVIAFALRPVLPDVFNGASATDLTLGLTTAGTASTPSQTRYGQSIVDLTLAATSASIRTTRGWAGMFANLLPNPSFETDKTDWYAYSGTLTRDTGEHYYGVGSGKFVSNGATYGESVSTPGASVLTASPGQIFRFSAWVKGEAGRSMQIGLDDYLDDAWQDGSVSTFVASGEWQRVEVIRKTGANVDSVAGFIRNNGTFVQTFYVDEARVSRSINVAVTTAGSRVITGAATQALTATFTTAGTRTLHGAATQALTATLLTASKVTAKAASVLPLTLSQTTNGTRTALGAVSLSLTFGALTAGTGSTPSTTQYGASVVNLTYASTTAGTRETRGAVFLSLTSDVTTSARIGAKAASTTALTFAATTSGKITARTASTSSITLGVATAAGVSAKGTATQALTANFTSQSTATKWGQSLVALTLDATTSAVRTLVGKSSFALDFDRTTLGTATTPPSGAVSWVSFAVPQAPPNRVVLATTFSATTAGSVEQTYYGASVVDLTIGLTTSSLRTGRGSSTLPITLDSTTSGRLGARAAVVLPLTLGSTSVGRISARAAVVLPLTLTLTTDGQIKGKVYGASSMALALASTTQGRLGGKGQIVLPLSLASTTQGRLGARGAVVLPLTLARTTSGTRALRAQVVLPLTLTNVSAGRAAKAGASSANYTLTLTSAGMYAKRGRAVVPLSVALTDAGYTETHGQVVLPLTVALDAAGYASQIGSLVELSLLLGLTTKGIRQGGTLHLLDVIYTGRIADTAAGYVAEPETGVVEEELEEVGV